MRFFSKRTDCSIILVLLLHFAMTYSSFSMTNDSYKSSIENNVSSGDCKVDSNVVEVKSAEALKGREKKPRLRKKRQKRTSRRNQEEWIGLLIDLFFDDLWILLK